MAASSTVSNEHHLQLAISACSSVIDGDYEPTLDNASAVVGMAAAVKQLCLSPSPEVDSFFLWLHRKLGTIVNKAAKRRKKVSSFKEKVWSEFHALRSSEEFVRKWREFLASNALKEEPLFYQQISVFIFSHLMKQAFVTPSPAASSVPVTPLTYEEESAVRYMCGYVIRDLRKENASNRGFLLNLNDLCNSDDDSEPAESEEWTCAIDRGGLIRVTEDMFQTVLAIEYVTRTIYNETYVDKMGPSYLIRCVEDIVDASDVQFHWLHASAQMPEVVGEHILERIVRKWLTIRGFSFTKSILEQYKREAKKGTQKSKPLRSTLAPK